MTIKLASFDVFDSALARDALVPSDVFPRAAARILAGMGRVPGLSASDIAQLRVQAELRARARISGEDVTLAEIWEELAAMLGWPADPAYAIAEMAEEAACLGPVESTRRLIHECRRRYGKVAFVSDSYFSRAFIEGQLRAHGLMADGDSLYVSSELRSTKATGSLFRHLAREEGLEMGELRHYGDNAHSDVRVPGALGIDARRLTVPDLTRNERALFAEPLGSLPILRDLSAASRQFRLANAAPDETAAGTSELVGSFLGPFCALFAAWTLASARDLGLRRLYFCARDCQLVWRAARILAPSFGDIDCRYLHVSRHALLLPSVERSTREQLGWLRLPYEAPMLEGILAKLELVPGDCRALYERLGAPIGGEVRLGDDAAWDIVWSELERAPLDRTIERKASERRATAISYFRSQGLLDDARVALVDIGWRLSSQASLRKILRSAGHPGDVLGLYLQLNEGRQPPGEAGAAHCLFHEPAADLRSLQPHAGFGRLAYFLEHVVGLADHPRTSGYQVDADGRGMPVFASGGARLPRAETIADIQRKLEDYVRTYGTRIAGFVHARGESGLVLRRVVTSFFENASRPCVDCLRGVSIAADQNDRDERPLAGPLGWRDALRPAIPARFQRDAGRWSWPHGDLLLTPAPRNALYRVALGIGTMRSRLRRALRARAWSEARPPAR